MKTIFFALLALFLSLVMSNAKAQLPDSVLTTYASIESKSQKSNYLINHFSLVNVDSLTLSTQYCQRAAEYFKSQNDNFGYFHATISYATKFWRAGDYNRTISILLDLLPDIEKQKDTASYVYALSSLSIAFSESKHYRESIYYVHKMLNYINADQQANVIGIAYNNLADTYVKLGNKDSALWCLQKAIYYIEKDEDAYRKMLVYTTASEFYFSNKDLALALAYIDKALALDSICRDRNLFCYGLLIKAEVKLSMEQADSAIYYARKSLHSASPDLNAEIMLAAEKLHQYYALKQNTDSMYKYHLMYTTYKDSIFDTDKMVNIRKLEMKEELRRIQDQEQEAKRKKERKHTLQLIGISIFILTFLIFALVFRYRKPGTKTMEILGVLAVLLLFEFISMLLHPFFERITHHNPFLMLLCLVAVGAVVAPLHHKMTGYLKNKMH